MRMVSPDEVKSLVVVGDCRPADIGAHVSRTPVVSMSPTC
jgi:hypothetical protein